jgi:hypothetical protein
MKKSLEISSVAVSARKRSALQLERRDSLRRGGQRDRLAVLVGAGEEERRLAAGARVAGHHIRGDRLVGVPEVGHGVDVVDRCRYVVGHRCGRAG